MKTCESSVCTEEKCFLSDKYLLGHVQKVMKEIRDNNMYLCYIVKETVKEETPAANLPGGTIVQLLSLV